MATFWNNFVGQPTSNDNKSSQLSWRQGLEKRLTDLAGRTDKGARGALSGLLPFQGFGETEQSLDGHGGILRPKRSILMLCADTLRATASMVLGDPSTGASKECTKDLGNSLPSPSRTPTFRAWTTRRRKTDTVSAFELPEVRSSDSVPCPSVMGINIPSSQLLLCTSALRLSEDTSYHSMPHRHHRRSSITSEILWPRPVSVALTPLMKPHTKSIAMGSASPGHSRSPYETATEGEFLDSAAMDKGPTLTMTLNSDGYISGTESNGELSGTDGFEAATLDMGDRLKAPEIPPRGVRLSVQSLGPEYENMESVVLSTEPQNGRLTSSNYEADAEDNLFVPTMGYRDEYEARRADRAKRYSLIWGDPIEDSKIRACLDHEDGYIHSADDDDKELVQPQLPNTVGKENKVKPKENWFGSDSTWKKTVRWVDNDVLKPSGNNSSLRSPREPPPYDSWDGTLIFNENVFEVDSLHAELRDGFLVVGTKLTSSNGSPKQELPAPLWSQPAERIQNVHSKNDDIDPAWNVTNDLSANSCAFSPTLSRADDLIPPCLHLPLVPSLTNPLSPASRSPLSSPSEASGSFRPTRSPSFIPK